MPDAAANVRLDHSIHFRVSDQRDQPVNVFKERVPRKLRHIYKVGRVELVLVRVVPESLKHVGQQANIAQKVELYIFYKTRAMKVTLIRPKRVRSPFVNTSRLRAY